MKVINGENWFPGVGNLPSDKVSDVGREVLRLKLAIFSKPATVAYHATNENGPQITDTASANRQEETDIFAVSLSPTA